MFERACTRCLLCSKENRVKTSTEAIIWNIKVLQKLQLNESVGMLPESKLFARDNFCSDASLVWFTFTGILPEISLEERSSSISLDSFHSSSGNWPVSELLYRNKVCRLPRSPRCVGNEDARVLVCICKNVKFRSWPKEVGICPCSGFWFRWTLINFKVVKFELVLYLKADCYLNSQFPNMIGYLTLNQASQAHRC